MKNFFILVLLASFIFPITKVNAVVVNSNLDEFGINISQQTGIYTWPSNTGIVSDGNEGVIIVWSDNREGPDEYDIFAQRVNSSGSILWSPGGVKLIDQDTTNLESQIKSDGNGGFYLMYQDGSDFRVRRFDNNGNSVWGSELYFGGYQNAAYDTDPSGNLFVIGFQDSPAPRLAYGIYDINQNLVDGDTILLNPSSTTVNEMKVTAASDGAFYTTYIEDAPASETKLLSYPNTWVVGDATGVSLASDAHDGAYNALAVGNSIIAVTYLTDTDRAIDIISRSTGESTIPGGRILLSGDDPGTFGNMLLNVSPDDAVYLVSRYFYFAPSYSENYLQIYSSTGTPILNLGTAERLTTLQRRESPYGIIFNSGIAYIIAEEYNPAGLSTANYYTVYGFSTSTNQRLWPDSKIIREIPAGYEDQWVLDDYSPKKVFKHDSAYAMLSSGSNIFFYNVAYDDVDGYENVFLNTHNVGFQIDNLDSDLDASVTNLNVETTSNYGVQNSQSLTLKQVSTDNAIVSVNVNFSRDFNWGSVEGESSDEGVTYVNNLSSAGGVTGFFTMYTLKQPGDNGVRVCPGASSLAAVTTTCIGGYDLVEGDSTLSIGDIDGSDYWVVTGLTGTGIRSALIEEDETPTEETPSEETPEEEESEEDNENARPNPNLPGTGNNGQPGVPLSFPVVVNTPNTETDGTIEDYPTYISENNVVSVNETVSTTENIPSIIPAVVAVASIATIAVSSGGIISYTANYLGILITRKKKYWGVIYSAEKLNKIAFVTIRIYKKIGNTKVFLTQTISDLEGKYGVVVGETGEYLVEFIHESYRTEIRDLLIQENSDIILDVGMIEIDTSTLPLLKRIRIFSKENASSIMNFLRIFVVILMSYGTYSTLQVISNNPTISNFLVLSLYVVTLILQLFILFRIFSISKSGCVLEEGSKRPVKGAIFRILYTDLKSTYGVENIAMTNESGFLKIRIDEGLYNYQVSKSGYERTVGKIQVDKSGKIIGNIMVKRTSATNSNPAKKFGEI